MEEASRRRMDQSRRRRANVAGGRTPGHRVRVSAEEEAQLVRMANERGMSVPRLLVESTLYGGAEGASVRREQISLLFTTYRMMAAIGNNLNQIARVANATGEISDELRWTLQRVRAVADRVDESLTELGRSGR